MALKLLTKSEKIKFKYLKQIVCEIGWKPGKTEFPWELEQIIVMLDKNGKIINETLYMKNDKIYIKNYKIGKFDKEKIEVDFTENAALDCQRIVFAINILEASYRRQDLLSVKEPYFYMYDENARNSLARYNIERKRLEFRNKTGMIIGEFYKQNKKWVFEVVGEPIRARDLLDVKEIITEKYSIASNAKKTWREFLKEKFPPQNLLEKLFK